MTVTIVVLNWNGADRTLACLESLAAADLRGASVLVVDNGSHDGSADAVRRRFPAQEVLVLPQNVGFAGGNNAGIGVGLERGADAVLLLNNDTRVAPDFLPPLLDAWRSGPRCAAVSSAILRMDRPDMLDVAWIELRLDRRSVVQIVGVNEPLGPGFDARREVEAAVGCSVLLDAGALRAVGLLDEAYFAYHEDVDWCLRARRAGYHVLWEPRSRVFHAGSSSTDALRRRPDFADTAPWQAQLPNAEPLPWNPVRTYLGARNLVRLLRTHATAADRRAFVGRCARDVPLEFFAAVLGRLGWMRLGRWTWRRMLHFYLVERHPALRTAPAGARGTLRRMLLLPVTAPADLCWFLPRDVVRGVRQGRTIELAEYLRGLWDGYRDRPIPYARLGLR
jgi:GT2 family glycosyltransferase